MERFRVEVKKDYLLFAAAHFITFSGHACESLHGHNYRIGITVEGPIDAECLFVVDFALLKRVVRRHVDAMDHRVLLPTENPKLAFRSDGDATLVDYFGVLTYRFPTRDCAMLPIRNTTAEMLAEWVGRNVLTELRAEGVAISSIELEIEESPGQSATWSSGDK